MSTIVGSSVEQLNARHCINGRVEIRYSKVKGRYVVAKEKLTSGEAFFVSQAYSNVIASDMAPFVCAHCRDLKYEDLEEVAYDVSHKDKKSVDMELWIKSRRLAQPLRQPFKCERCQFCHYCSEQCKDDHYRTIHELECESFAAIRKLEEETPDIGLMDLDWNPTHERQLLRHLVRILVKRYEEQSRGGLCAVSTKSRDSDAGEVISSTSPSLTYQEDILNLIFKTKASEEHIRVANEAKQILPLKYQPADPSEMVQVLSRIDCNKFGLFGRRGEVNGSQLHPTASFVNHSCLPNAFSHIVGNSLTLYTLYPVDVGEELNISYLEPQIPLKDRRHQLKDIYGFDCICKRCTKEASKDARPKQLYDDFFDTYLNCPLCHNGLLLVPDEAELKGEVEEAAKDLKRPVLPPEEGITEYRLCNGCYKLQTLPVTPTLAQWKLAWKPSDQSKKSTKTSKPKRQRHKDSPSTTAPSQDQSVQTDANLANEDDDGEASAIESSNEMRWLFGQKLLPTEDAAPSDS